MILVRFLLISLIAYLIIRTFLRFGKGDEPSPRKPEPEKGDKIKDKKVSKEIGEYIDYEEVDE